MKKSKKVEQNDGPLLLAANPNQRYVEQDTTEQDKNGKVNKQYLPPQRIWENENTNNNQNYQVNNFVAQSQPALPQSVRPKVLAPNRNSYEKKHAEIPNTIREVTCQISSTGEDGEEVFEENQYIMMIFKFTDHLHTEKKLKD